MTRRNWIHWDLGVSLILIALLLVGCGASGSVATPVPDVPVFDLKVDGSGDYATLHEAVQAVPERSILSLGPGTFRLDAPLDISKPLSLVGAGLDKTEIVGESTGFVVRFLGVGPFTAEGLTIRHEGDAVADVVVVDGGQIDFARIRFAGEQGVGLHLDKGTGGMVESSIIEVSKKSIGILVAGQSEPTLKSNTSSGNGYGIRIIDQAQPTLIKNTCADNEMDGIRYDDDTGGLAIGNELSRNRTGIVVTGQAQPTLEENTVSDNRGAGIEYMDDAAGIALRNKVSANFGGIGISGAAQPSLQDNVIFENTTAGIAYFRQSSGVARANECKGNGIDGISVLENASPTLEENICNENGERGINYDGEAAGIARNNECAGNRVGIAIAATSNPQLEGNRIQGNTEADIQDLRP